MNQSIKDILSERQTTHGDFSDNSKVSQAMKKAMVGSKNWTHITDYQREALDMIVHKISRILSGNPNHVDAWQDIGGYATLTADRVNTDFALPQEHSDESPVDFDEPPATAPDGAEL